MSAEHMTFAERMQHIEGSGVRKMFELVATMKDPINLSIGQADYDAPDSVKEAAIQAIQAGHNRYTMTQGLPPLNEKVLDRMEGLYGHRPETAFMTSGVSGGLLLSVLALLDEGDEVLVPDPYFVMYTNVLALVGAKPVFYDLYPSDTHPGWGPRVDELDALCTPRTKMILVNSPSNPTGGVLTGEELDGLCNVAEKHGLWVLSDEIYENFIYGEQRFESMVTRMPRWNKTIVLGGASKTYGVPGWRLGWAAGPTGLLDKMQLLQQYTFVCAPAPLQHATIAMLDTDMSAQEEAYKKKQGMVVDKLSGHFELVPSQGSFYAFPAYPKGMAEKDFVQATLDRNILIVPGSAFSRKDTHFRLSFAAPDEMLERGLDLLVEIAKG
jgi:aminotransferase